MAAMVEGTPVRGKMQRQPSIHSMEDSVGYAFVPAAMAMRKDYDVHEAVMLVKHAWASYMDADGPGTCTQAQAPPDGSFDVEGGVRGTLAKGMGRPDHPIQMVSFANVRETGTQCYVAKSEDLSEAIISIRGSTTLHDFVNDGRFLQTVWEPDEDERTPGACSCFDAAVNKDTVPMVHLGFYHCLLSIKEYVHQLVELSKDPKCLNVDICGHSLGAGIGQLVFAYFLEHADVMDMVARGARLTLFGIGQPRSGNKAWVGYIHHLAQPLEDAGLLRVYRLIDNMDLICSIPPMFKNYSHFGEPALYLARFNEEKVLMMGTKCDRSDEDTAKDFGTTAKDMEKGLGAIDAASCFACFQKTTRWLYNPDELYKDHQLKAYFDCVVATANKYETGELDKGDWADDENLDCPVSPSFSLSSPLTGFTPGDDAGAAEDTGMIDGTEKTSGAYDPISC
mmetsp:Transcript_79235/g.226406  ORF Transcript_79235/g.226406 Transcript_79235/m.226406 type:complete len:451 (+) Transcript_79235:151-1503(+)|eukprot:CAMPEP_0119522730 /NCGR_PEP_ID=MMETSP1344-20130328/37957_1 /TAXON_ID=236787 /ORGANISM="Florenciella parvula, Strain CCMP2471" /LENGTH=450 /DNA_ID=CAMNT_0007560781 /DNA_START=108 /DNA_END=1460 /DNA_ORIENTATION=+